MRAKCPQCKGPTASMGLTCSSCMGGAHSRRGTIIVERDAVPTEVECEDPRVVAPAPIGFKDDGLGPGNAGPLKPRPELLPAGPILEVSKVLAWGAKKYTRNGQDGAGNWLLVANGRVRYLGACMRHLFAYMAGQRVDEESGLPTLAHAATDLLFAFGHDMAEQEKQ